MADLGEVATLGYRQRITRPFKNKKNISFDQMTRRRY